ncbi:DnaB-like helicase C-terminal domain-containing protein [Halomonas sp. OfavH-34-E]|uniref:replicative DNA helicase n=1 Tax=Halomonas sp. OfavH-34-E TaxID=2954491 RepID=UPI0020972A84|nr:DnaB-like helicase C-terminal domain-containing protein [Halomonas sp. OfavH-34-E]MCO7217868.1 AAA family ATPase [Halomonas sp. OfavH-34-E]
MIYSEEAEASLIGACLLDPSQIDVVAGEVSAEDFYLTHYRAMWSAIQQLAMAGTVDVISLHELVSNMADEYGGLPGLIELTRNTPNPQNAKHYAVTVHDKALRRRLQIAFGELNERLEAPGAELSRLIDQAQAKLAGVMGQRADAVTPVKDWLSSWVDDLDARLDGRIDPMGLLFNLPELDAMTSGMHSEDLIVLGGESGMGKTVVAAHILDSVCLRQNKPAVMFQLEMRKEQVLNRVMGSYTGVKLDAFKNPRKHMDDEGWSKVGAGMTAAKESGLVIDDRPGLTPTQMRAAAKRWKEHFGELGCVIIDHAGIVQPDDRSVPREQQMAEVSKAGKILAKELGCPVILLAQINRENTKRNDKRPVMSDLRESASLEHNADMILFIYRDAKHNPDCEYPGIAELIVAKQRDGQVGSVSVVCDLSRSQLLPATAENIANYHREFPRQSTAPAAEDKFAL